MAREVVSELTGSQGLSGDSTSWENNEYGTGNVQLRNGTTIGILNVTVKSIQINVIL